MSKLNISSEQKLPFDMITQTFAILAKRRVGKTYAASVIAEEMVRAGLPFVALDPTGAWYGLRSSADGSMKPANYSPHMKVGVSSPPDYFRGEWLSRSQQEAMLRRSLAVLTTLAESQPARVTWMSFEPLSWDVSPIVQEFPNALQWAVIGAASNGREYHQPAPAHVERLLDVLDLHAVKVFFKGNLKWDPRREEFPV